MCKLKITIEANKVNQLMEGDFVVHFDVENLIEIYDNTNAPQELTYYNSNPELDHEVTLDNRVKAEIVRKILTDFIENELINYVNAYVETHQDSLYEMQEDIEKLDRLEYLSFRKMQKWLEIT